mgnify:CR=1 FL=1
MIKARDVYIGLLFVVLGPAVRLLANLAMVADNVGFLATHGGTEALLRAIEAGLKLPPSEEREALLASACLVCDWLCLMCDNVC